MPPKEKLALVEGIKKYRVYLQGKKFYVYTDHNALKWLMSGKKPTGKLARWSLLIQEFDFEILYRPGRVNGNADALSRFPYEGPINPITYGGGGGGFLARTIRLLTITLNPLYLAPPNLVTFSFYLLDTFWQNFGKIDSPGGLLQLFLK